MTKAQDSSAFKRYEESVSALIDKLHLQVTAAAQGTDMRDMEAWDAGWAQVEEGVKDAKQARDGYQNYLRENNYGF